MTSPKRRTVSVEVYLALAGLAIVLLAVLRPPAGPIIAPVIIQGQGNQVQPATQPRAEAALPVRHAPGDVCLVGGSFRPVGALRGGREAVGPREFRIGEVFPGLPEYADGATWVRE